MNTDKISELLEEHNSFSCEQVSLFEHSGKLAVVVTGEAPYNYAGETFIVIGVCEDGDVAGYFENPRGAFSSQNVWFVKSDYQIMEALQ